MHTQTARRTAGAQPAHPRPTPTRMPGQTHPGTAAAATGTPASRQSPQAPPPRCDWSPRPVTPTQHRPPPKLTVLGEVGPAGRPAAGEEQQQGQGGGAPHGASRPAPRYALASLGPRGRGLGSGWATTLTDRAPPSHFEPGAEAGTGREPALLQSRGLNRALGANHSVGGGGGAAGGWAGRGGAKLPHSPLPPPLTPPPLPRGAFHLLPRELRQPGAGVEPREGAGSAVGPGAHPS